MEMDWHPTVVMLFPSLLSKSNPEPTLVGYRCEGWRDPAYFHFPSYTTLNKQVSTKENFCDSRIIVLYLHLIDGLDDIRETNIVQLIPA